MLLIDVMQVQLSGFQSSCVRTEIFGHRSSKEKFRNQKQSQKQKPKIETEVHR